NSVRFSPSGVSSNAHAMISATGKPSAVTKITSRMAQFEISRNGNTCVATWINSQPTTAYATATLYTLRRFSSAKMSPALHPSPLAATQSHVQLLLSLHPSGRAQHELPKALAQNSGCQGPSDRAFLANPVFVEQR